MVLCRKTIGLFYHGETLTESLFKEAITISIRIALQCSFETSKYDLKFGTAILSIILKLDCIKLT